MKAADSAVGAARPRPDDRVSQPVAGVPTIPDLSARRRFIAALLGIVIALLVAAACGAIGVLLASTIFRTTGGIL